MLCELPGPPHASPVEWNKFLCVAAPGLVALDGVGLLLAATWPGPPSHTVTLMQPTLIEEHPLDGSRHRSRESRRLGPVRRRDRGGAVNYGAGGAGGRDGGRRGGRIALWSGSSTPSLPRPGRLA